MAVMDGFGEGVKLKLFKFYCSKRTYSIPSIITSLQMHQHQTAFRRLYRTQHAPELSYTPASRSFDSELKCFLGGRSRGPQPSNGRL